ncbi:VOC family protein [Wenjunlia tyrosinilytica]|uniref:Glyoxalase n=1 Tax=Wenjunlia tyrosinilytica TaxID=1544741 RepID=A0A918DVP2_9ACTN|nr:VOC family protein [Wenjunlia tyrosinilytica]GGO84623.1 glyoxalase [Wenjunlia tyrosinilytica]
MPEVIAPYPPGTPCWVDLIVPDQPAALDFYHQLFGWTGEIGPPEYGGYAVCSLKGKPVAGIMARPQAPEDQAVPTAAWTTYLASADADGTARSVTDNGGVVLMPPTEVPAMGRMLIAADPAGAAFGVWQALEFFGSRVVNEPGSLVWSELNTTDPEAAAAFYPRAIGIGVAPMEGIPGYHGLDVNGRVVGGMQQIGDDFPPGTPPHWLPYFSVGGTDATVDTLVKAGGGTIRPAFDMPAGRMAVVHDQQGAVFAIIDATGPEPDWG